jgi:type I restriction enzyme M protein
MAGFQEKVSFIWSVANEVLRDDFKRGKYPDVILPFTVLRRIDCVLKPTKDKVLDRQELLKKKGVKNPEGQLYRASGYSFYNISPYDFEKLLEDPKNIGKNLRAYINGFSENMLLVLEKFKLHSTIETLDSKGLLFLLIKKFDSIDLHPDTVSNHEMGTIFEELIRKFNEQMNENPGEHFTPREVIRLMVRLLINGDKDILSKQAVVRTCFDPACGSGGMLSIAKEYIHENINESADIILFGQEVNDETFAVCKSDMLIKGDDRDAKNIMPDSSFSKDGHKGSTFDYMLCNPPYGKDWKKEKTFINEEAERGISGRFEAGTPRISDGQLLFLQHMISKMKPVSEGGSRIAIIMNGSPLFTGDAGSGESEIRRWILENDWLEAIVAMPEQLFYNTGIATYVWILTNRKLKKHKGKVQLINATSFWTPMKKSLGDKRREILPDQIDSIIKVFNQFKEGDHSKIFDTTDFCYRKITVERPLRLNFQASPERIERIKQETAFINLARSKKRKEAEKEAEEKEGRKLQKQIMDMLETMPDTFFKSLPDFEEALEKTAKKAGLKLKVPIKKAVISALSERDETAEIVMDKDGNPEPDPQLRDTENVPFKEDIQAYFEREVIPHVPDAWINTGVRDHKDGQTGKVGYEISFTRYFYQYQPPRPLEQIDADIQKVEAKILEMLKEVTQ